MIRRFREYLTEADEGIGTVEMILILVVLVALVLLFREEIFGLVEGVFANINESVNELY